MNIIQQKINGYQHQQHSLTTFILDQNAPHTFYLRYALVIMGPETPIFPESLLDDWGTEITGLKLYRWFHEFAPRFPRAEVFGLGPLGRPTQHFLREFEHYLP
ncbi:MAG TPA: hypothetical protein VLL52_17245, partial [Anaerolineae bacterium]|nr:hypothetical protein [Anaerolineae bacterium]